MSGTVSGGKKAAEKNKAQDKDFYSKIALKSQESWKLNGRKPRGFSTKTPCDCADIPGEHHKGQCAGKRGGFVSRRNKKAMAEAV